MSFSSGVTCAACGAVRLSQALTIVTVRVFGALPDFIHGDTDTPAWACAVRARVFCARMRFGAPKPLVIWALLHAAGSNLAVYLRAGPELLRTVAWRRTSVRNRAVECRFRPRYAPFGARERVPWPVRRMARSRMYTTRTTLNTHANDRVHAKRGPHRRWVITSGLTRGVAFTLRKRASAGAAR